METGGFLFDPSLCRGNMLFLGNGGNPLFGGATSIMTMEESSKRRPFFGSSDEFFDEEYYDEQGPEKKRRLTAEQVHLLEKSFETENKLEPERKTQLAKKLGLQPRQVAVWFQNRRARWKTKQLEREYDLLKSSYDSMLDKYNSIAKENEQLKSEVTFLTEKLGAREVVVGGGGAPIAAAGPKSISLPTDDAHHASAAAAALQMSTKVEDRLSSGSGGSAVVDEDGPLLLDSGDSFFPFESYPTFVGPIDGVQSEEDEGSNDGQNYFPDVIAVAEQQSHHGDGEPLDWWVWPLGTEP